MNLNSMYLQHRREGATAWSPCSQGHTKSGLFVQMRENLTKYTDNALRTEMLAFVGALPVGSVAVTCGSLSHGIT